MQPGRLYVVATPIGNLADMTVRAVQVLRDADLIACEDTRHSRTLLNHYGISTPMTSYHEHNEAEKAEELLEQLNQGRSIALITDAGTPGVSDPGYRLVRGAREQGVPVSAVPGPSAVIAALSVSGLPSDRFTFHGFLPRKVGEWADLVALIEKVGGTHIFYESPHRVARSLELLAERLPRAEACLARELTKVYEEVIVAPTVDLARHCAEGSPPRGECVILVHVPPDGEPEVQSWSDGALRARVEEAMSAGDLSRRDAIRQVAAELNLPRKVVYAAATGDA